MENIHNRALSKRYIFIIIFTIILIFAMKPTKNGLCHDYTKAELSGKPLTKAEQFVLERVSKGETANLSQFFGFGGRPIRAAFLKKVLTNRFEGINLSGCPINIQNAIILDNLDLTNQIINEEVGLFNCTFTEKVLFDKTIFKKDLDFHDSTLKDWYLCKDLK